MIQTELLDRMPPANVESEGALLGALLLDASQFDAVTAIVRARDFYDDSHSILFDALLTIHEARKPINDIVVVNSELKSMGIYERIGGAAALAKMFQRSTGSHATFYAKEIRRLARLRDILDTSFEAVQRAFAPDADPTEVANWLDTRQSALSMDQTATARTVGEISQDVLDDLDADDTVKRGVMTGLLTIDQSVGVIMPGEVCVIAARPGNGKTSMGLQIAQHNAERDRQALFISLEMSDAELTQRLMCSIAKVDSTKIRTRTTSTAERKRMIEAAATIRDMPLRILAPPGATAADIRGAARLQAKTAGVDLLVVDYLQRIRGSDTRLRKHEQLAEITNRLKDLAREINAPILELCQINRESEKNNEPRLSHLSESSTIENDADIVLFLHHTKSGTDAIIAKHRHGDTGTVPLSFNGPQTRFEER
ncbi:MAG: DnaB-like helicase C-terminal domain-containing protein [Pirellulaceae bacterium]|nr:DnaB-like helicase C-terminal domain-containing protein [Pirellulaceae bacterium]HJN09776.1 DnaB-like helicase C-terminal domain-containing protein [Pirellulaceae bacterium]